MRRDRLLTTAIIVALVSLVLLICTSVFAQAAPPQTPEAVRVPAVASNVVRMGTQGAQVATVQQALVDGGWPTWVDGDFGPHTEATVRLFQRANGLQVDGLVGPATLAALGISQGATDLTGVGRSEAPPAVSSDGCYAALLAKYGLPGSFTGIIHRESRCQPAAHNPNGADNSYGLLQLNTKGALWGELASMCGLTNREQLFDPETNIACASKLYARYGGRPWRT